MEIKITVICFLALYVLGSLLISAISVCVSCTLCWMVHGKYQVPTRFRLWILKYLGKLSIPTRKSDEMDIIEDMLSQIRRRSVHRVSLKQGGLTEVSELVGFGHTAESFGEMFRLSRGEERKISEKVDGEERTVSISSETPQFGLELPATLNRLSTMIEDIKGSIQSEVKTLKGIQSDIHYMALEKIKNRFSPDEIAKEHMKELAVILNRFSGIILTLFNIVLTIYTGLVMFTPWNGFALF